MDGWQFSPEVHQLVNDIFVWIGFGTVVGVVSRALMPGPDPAGVITNLILGVAGTVIGCGCVGFFIDSGRVMPTTLLGMISSVMGAFILLGCFRMYGDLLPWKLPDPHGSPDVSGSHSAYDAYRRRYGSADYED